MSDKKRGVIYISILVFLFVSNAGYCAEYTNPQLLVSPADIQKNAATWVILDCREPKTTIDKKTSQALKGYNDGHVPGAVNLGGDCAKVLRDEKSRVRKTDEVAKILGDAGISSDKTVVVYEDAKRITDATVGFWILDYEGQRDVRFLNGGIEAWQAAGGKLDEKATKLPPAKYDAHVHKEKIATTEEVLKIAKGEDSGSQLVDSRTPGEYKGTDVRAKRGGHVPHCPVNISHVELYDKATGKIKSMDDLNKIYGGLDKTRRVIPYCQTGTRSTLAYLVFRLMGFRDPANYDDSWIIWGNSDDLPIEK